MQYKRVILKFSGEMLLDRASGNPLFEDKLYNIANEIKLISDSGVELGVVIGGGNITRGVSAKKTNKHSRTTADNIGMLATAINALALQNALNTIGVDSVILSAVEMQKICDFYTVRAAEKAFDGGKVAIFSCGTGNPFFSTDSGAALRAGELNADVFIKATKVDGIYDKDPKKFPDAKKYNKLSFQEALNQHLNVMDQSAFSICMDNNVKLIVIDGENDISNIHRVLCGESLGTIVE